MKWEATKADTKNTKSQARKLSNRKELMIQLNFNEIPPQISLINFHVPPFIQSVHFRSDCLFYPLQSSHPIRPPKELYFCFNTKLNCSLFTFDFIHSRTNLIYFATLINMRWCCYDVVFAGLLLMYQRRQIVVTIKFLCSSFFSAYPSMPSCFLIFFSPIYLWSLRETTFSEMCYER